MRVLITGAHGMLGHRLLELARARGHEATGTDRADLDVTDAAAVARRVAALAPEAVIHCAAFTDVDGAEEREEHATRVNGEGTAHVARAAAQAGAFVVLVSTDYVFAGDAGTPYSEADEPHPQTAYGRSKLAGERALMASGADWAICRTAWLFGAGGRNFVDTILALAEQRDELQVVADQIGCPTWTGHLAPALLDIAQDRAGGIHHLVGAGECSWFDLAVEALARAGADCRVTPTTTDRLARPARRPACSVLRSERPDAITMPDWRQGLRAHLSERKVAVS